jgi:hypothetical protein
MACRLDIGRVNNGNLPFIWSDYLELLNALYQGAFLNFRSPKNLIKNPAMNRVYI